MKKSDVPGKRGHIAMYGCSMCEWKSEFGVVGSAGEGDDVADVGHACHEEHETFEAEAEA